MLEFQYTNRGPSPWNVSRTNTIRLWWDGSTLVMERHYGTKVKDNPIVSRFDGGAITVFNIARGIHWSCCGWVANSSQLWQLQEHIREFVELVDPHTVQAAN